MSAGGPAISARAHANQLAWTDATLAAAWRRWSPKLSVLLAQATDLMLLQAQARDGHRVLDLAAGTGDPAISLARMVRPTGTVTATDLGADMLESARDRAADEGLDNLRVQVADAHSLPFGDDKFDIVTCRFGIMYFADVPRALGEVRRVLRSGGRCVLLAWGPASQPYFACTRGIVERYIDVPASPHAPDTFAFARRGALSGALARAGFVDVVEEAAHIELMWPGPPEEMWRFFQDVTAAFTALRRRFPGDWAVVTGEVHEALRRHGDGTRVAMPAIVNVASARVAG
jgi:SAM-dependent methyltransferase